MRKFLKYVLTLSFLFMLCSCGLNYKTETKDGKTVYNIENKENPQYEREVQIEGDYLSSRMIGENIYFMANKYIYCNLPE